MSDADELWLSELRTSVYDKEWKFYKNIEFRFFNENGTVKEVYSRVYYLPPNFEFPLIANDEV